MTSYINIDLLDSDNWSASDLQQSICINPNLICPTEVIANVEPQVFGNVTNIVNQTQQQQLQNAYTQQEQQQQQQQLQHHQEQQQYQLTWSDYSDNSVAIYHPCSSTIQCHYQQQQQQRQQLFHDNKPSANNENKAISEIQFQQQQLANQQLHLDLNASLQLDQHQHQHQKHQNQNQQQSYQNQFHYQTLLDQPPLLAIQEVPKHDIQEKWRQHNESARKRRESIKERIEKEPARYNTSSLRKISGKKMTGRERQLELERQEAHELHLRDYYRNSIRQLERKCKKLREILENIVTTSPDYDMQIKNFMDIEEPSSSLAITTSEYASHNSFVSNLGSILTIDDKRDGANQ